MAVFPGFIGPSYQSRSLNEDAEECVNLYLETASGGTGKNRAVLYGTPGLAQTGYSPVTQSYTVLPGAIMAMAPVWDLKAGKQEIYILTTGMEVNSTARTIKLCRFSALDVYATATLPNVSSGQPGNPPQAAFMASNGKQLLIALKMADYYLPSQYTSSLLYVYDMTAPVPALTQVASWDVTQPITGLDFLDGFFLITTTTSLYASANGDGTAWDALSFTNENDEPDGIVGLVVSKRLVWVLGKTRIEAFYNAGAADFPFLRVPQGVIETGCLSAASAVKTDDGFFWVGMGKGGGPAVYRNNGYSAVRVSNPFVDSVLAEYATIPDQVNPAGSSGYAGVTIGWAYSGMRAYSYTEDGHTFYVLNFGGVNPALYAAYGYPVPADPSTTLVYDITEGVWHERKYSADGVNFTRHLGNFYAYDSTTGQHVVSDYRNAVLYRMALSNPQDGNDRITRWRTAPHLSEENKRLFYSSFTLDCESGMTSQDGFQHITLQWSDDGGHTWSQPRTLQLAGPGNYRNRFIFRRLGKSRDRVFKVSTSDPARIAWINAYLEFAEGNS